MSRGFAKNLIKFCYDIIDMSVKKQEIPPQSGMMLITIATHTTRGRIPHGYYNTRCKGFVKGR